MKQAPHHADLWQGLLCDPDGNRDLYELAREAETQCAAAHVLMDAGNPDDAAVHIGRFGSLAGEISLRALRASPELAHFYGDQLGLAVGRFVEGQVIQGLYGRETAEAIAADATPLYMRGLPGTPIKLDDPLSLAEATTKDLLVLGQAMKSYQAEGRRGRPTGTAITTEDEARRARTMHTAGANWLEIAEALWGKRPDRDLDVEYEAIRRRVRARVNLGRKLAATN